MFEIINEFALSQSRGHIRRNLDDLPKYRDWHPSVFFTGTLSHNAVVEYGFNSRVASVRERSLLPPHRFVKVDAITRVPEQARLSKIAGQPGPVRITR